MWGEKGDMTTLTMLLCPGYSWRSIVNGGVLMLSMRMMKPQRNFFFVHTRVKWLPPWRVAESWQHRPSNASAYSSPVLSSFGPLKQYFPVFFRVFNFVTSEVPWVSGLEFFRTRTSNAARNAQYTFGLPPSHQHFPNTSTISKKLERSPKERLTHQVVQLSGYGITRQLVLGELDTEIRVRERLREAVESRIAWATCLQSSLGAVAENQGACIVQGCGKLYPSPILCFRTRPKA